MKIKYLIYGAIGIFVLYSALSGGSDQGEVEYEEVVMPTEGLVTIVKEMEPDLFKIDDEITVPTTEESLIVANYMDATTDTFTLAEARLMQSSGYQGREGSVMRAASYGFFGYMMMSRMTGARPNPNAYTSKQAHQRTSSKAGTSMAKTATRTTRVKPGSGKSGFGKSSGKSSRSYGG